MWSGTSLCYWSGALYLAGALSSPQHLLTISVTHKGFNPAPGVFNYTYANIQMDIVKRMNAKGIYVLLDMHEDVLSSKFCLCMYHTCQSVRKTVNTCTETLIQHNTQMTALHSGSSTRARRSMHFHGLSRATVLLEGGWRTYSLKLPAQHTRIFTTTKMVMNCMPLENCGARLPLVSKTPDLCFSTRYARRLGSLLGKKC